MIVRMEDFGLQAGTESDATLPVILALRHCKEVERPELVFPKGKYHFRPDKAIEKYVMITNHDQGGTRRTAFAIEGMRELTIDGQGSEFIFHGGIIPFTVEHSQSVAIRRLSIDWERPMFDQGTVEEVREDSFLFRLRDGVPYKAEGGRLLFEYNGGWEPVWGLHDIDPATMAHAYGSGDRISWSRFKKLRLDEAGPRLIRVSGEIRHMPKVGHVIAMRFGRRENPGLFLSGSSDIRVEDVDLYHAPGMGLVAQRCTNIRLERFNVRLKPGSDRVITATADAVHFTNCRGTVEIEHCLFENQLDDPCNVHGIYARIAERVNERTLLIQLMHEMHRGVEMVVPEDAMNFVNHESLLTYGSGTVQSAVLVNADYSLVTFEQPLPDNVAVGDVLENMTWNPDLTVRHCTVRANRARGFLITTPGKVLLEHNVISAPGAGIKISGDANSWYESGAVHDVTIRGNRFKACNYCFPDWGRAVIDIDPEIEHPEKIGGFYHRNIRIEENVFEAYDIGLVSGHSVDGFVFRNNAVNRTEDYPMHRGVSYAIELNAVGEAEISGNDLPEDSAVAMLNGEEVRLESVRPIELQLIAFTDYHGYIRPHNDKSNGEVQTLDGPLTVGGAAYMAAHIKRLREGHAHSLLLSNGDNFSGWPFETSAFKNEPTVEVLNAIGVEVSSAGNHEFDVSADYLLRHMMRGESLGTPDVDGNFVDSAGRPFHGTDFPYICCNVRNAQTGELILPPYVIRHIPDGRGGAVPIGILGVLEEGALTKEQMSVQAGRLYVEPMVEAADRYASELQEQGVETIIVLLHDGGTADSSASDINGSTRPRGPAIDFARAASPAIDVIITGHWHATFNCMIDDPAGNPRPVVEGGCHGKLITEINLFIDPDTKDVIRGRTVCVNHPNTRDIEPDPQVAAIVDYWLSRADHKWAEPLAELTGDIACERNECGESPLGNLIADAFYAEARKHTEPVDLAITFGTPKQGLLCAKGPRPLDRDGIVTYGKLVEAVGAHTSEVVVTIIGRQLLKVLEEQWSVDAEGAVQFNPLNLSHNVLYAYDTGKAIGEKVSPLDVSINGEPLDLDRAYLVATTGGVVVNGGGYPAFMEYTDAIRIASWPIIDYVKSQGAIAAPELNRVRKL